MLTEAVEPSDPVMRRGLRFLGYSPDTLLVILWDQTTQAPQNHHPSFKATSLSACCSIQLLLVRVTDKTQDDARNQERCINEEQ